MHRPVNGSDRSDEQTMVRRLKREGAAARSELSAPLCERIMRAIDEVQQDRADAPHRSMGFPARENAWAKKPVLRSKRAVAITTAAALLAGLGWLAWPPASDPPHHTAVQATQRVPVTDNAPFGPAAAAQAEELASSLFSTTTVAIESWTALTESADPLEELSHDAQLAGQMVLAAVPLSD